MDNVSESEDMLPLKEISNQRTTSWSETISRYTGFLGLICTTTISCLLLKANFSHISVSGGDLYNFIISNRATIQIAIQLISTGLGFIQTAAMSRLINYATRIHLSRKSVPIEILNLWNGLCLVSLNWSLKLRYLFPLVAWVAICAIPAGLWAGAITPVVTKTSRETSIQVPQYGNMTSVREWPSEIDSSGPALRNEKGFFTYSPGVLFQGLLSNCLSSATTTNGAPRQHARYDNSKFIYLGRSFGVGGSVGLMDDHILNNTLATGYTYQEVGYATQTSCIYNSSTNFAIKPDDEFFAARGRLPDSAFPEFSVYVGHGKGAAIVAIGVAAQKPGVLRDRYLGIAAGSSYLNLNATQCKTTFQPALFNVSVALAGKNITVTQVKDTADDLEPSGNLTHSVIGNALNFSIADYRTYINSTAYLGPSQNESQINLLGLPNSIQAMTDDLLVAYASAQLMIANDTRTVDVQMTVSAVRFGQPVYVISMFAVNALVVLAVVVEAVRTRGWRGLWNWDYCDFRDLIRASAKGGDELLSGVEGGMRGGDGKGVRVMIREGEGGYVLGVAAMRRGSAIYQSTSRLVNYDHNETEWI
ncbi:hypothetical protein CJF32_00004492 [Rutstroemia sp. NJR-2017a WRK4]|nr:hypothetical protein CJF32_00004492 [Rutstroemia sp. NJR-2017a WRK4]